MDNKNLGQILTFYSYKGGTGRSMALANVACLLAQKYSEGQKVLMIDWDLEAPGLHRFFEDKFRKMQNQLYETQPGLIDLFYAMREACKTVECNIDLPDKYFDDLEIEKYILPTTIDSLYLLTAGKFDNSYSTRVSRFNWEAFFNQNPWLISSFANYLAKKFRFILIDSRTGFTDISSVCTALMPEKLVLVFTPNKQSLNGVIDLVKNVTEYRKKSDDLRPLVIYPLVSRVENAEEKLLEDWRFGNKRKGIDGYQPQFEAILKDVYKLVDCKLTEYFDDVIIQHVPRYSYGEEIAVLSSRREDRLSLAKSYEKLAQRLIELNGPWETVHRELIPELSRLTVSAERDAFDSKAVSGYENLRKNYTTRKQLRVFLVHASSDKPIVRKLCQSLSEEGWIDPWLDEEKLLPGQAWNAEISKAVESADVVLVCLSKNSMSKEGYIQKEIKFALDISLAKLDGTVFIIPMRLEECEVPDALKYWQWLDYFPETNRNRAYARLLASFRMRANSLGIKITNTGEEKSSFSIIIPSFPVYGRVTAGPRGEAYLPDSRELEEFSPVDESLQMIIKGRVYEIHSINNSPITITESRQYGWFEVSGDSMNSALPIPINDKDYVLFRFNHDILPCVGKIVLASLPEVEPPLLMVKRLQKVRVPSLSGFLTEKRNIYLLQSESSSPAYRQDIEIINNNQVVGEVIAVAKPTD